MKQFEQTLILTDLDGTLLNDAGQISPETQQAIRYYMENGGRFTVATGRSRQGMEHFFPALAVNAPAILYNGSAIYDFQTGEDLYEACVGEDGYRLAKMLAAQFPGLGIEVYARHRPYVAQESEHTRRHFASVKMQWNPCPAERIPQPWLYLVVTGESVLLAQVEKMIRERFPARFFLQYSSGHMLEILKPGANKGTAARVLAEHLGIPRERIYPVGDGLNDVELLQCALHSCAPENACLPIRTLARHILPDNEHHAIAALIRRLEKGDLL